VVNEEQHAAGEPVVYAFPQPAVTIRRWAAVIKANPMSA
jgi:hypothetical protein